VTPGAKTADTLAAELAAMELPDLRGRTVLDIGGWDGYFAFEAERRGAARVAVLDHYVWSLDLIAHQEYWRRCAAEGRDPLPYHETELWHPDTLPGKRGFDVARQARDSRVQEIVADFMVCDIDDVGIWDVVLYLGVLYHMEDPLAALRRLAAVTGQLAVVETEAVVVPGFEEQPLWSFFPGAELNADISNWWAPNMCALVGALRAVGFADVEVKRRADPSIASRAGGPHHFRAVVHARKP
jgi:tRNA (mo5U34)-methyltransferase